MVMTCEHACLRLDDGVCSGWLDLKQGFRQGYVLALLLSNILFPMVLNVAYMRFKADKDITNALLVPLRKNTGAGERDDGGEQLTKSQPS